MIIGGGADPQHMDECKDAQAKQKKRGKNGNNGEIELTSLHKLKNIVLEFKAQHPHQNQGAGSKRAFNLFW